jgi:methyl-accepting chemotaxis protein
MGLTSFLKNLLGTSKDSTSDLSNQTEDTNTETEETATSYIEKAETFVKETFIKFEEASEPIFEDATEYANQAKDIITEYVEKATDSINDIIDSVKESVETDETQPMAYNTVVDISEKPITEND